ncbi:MAG: S26 family signal peptidase [Acetivibrio ethanolgignens]
MEEMVLRKEEYFVLGDNRNFSIDSRSREIGAVKKEQIRGKVLFK